MIFDFSFFTVVIYVNFLEIMFITFKTSLLKHEKYCNALAIVAKYIIPVIYVSAIV